MEQLFELKTENLALREQITQRDVLITQLLERIQLLEARLAQDSHNSSKPPYLPPMRWLLSAHLKK